MMSNNKCFNCCTINLDIENWDDKNIVITSMSTVDHLIIKTNHCIEKIDILTLDKKFIKSFHVNNPHFVLNVLSIGADMCLIMIIFTGLPISHNLLLI